MHWPVAAAQSMRACRSLNSPIPKSSSLRSENTGIAVPAPRKPGWSKMAAWCALGKGQPGMGQSIHLSSMSGVILVQRWPDHSVRQISPSFITT